MIIGCKIINRTKSCKIYGLITHWIIIKSKQYWIHAEPCDKRSDKENRDKNKKARFLRVIRLRWELLHTKYSMCRISYKRKLMTRFIRNSKTDDVDVLQTCTLGICVNKLQKNRWAMNVRWLNIWGENKYNESKSNEPRATKRHKIWILPTKIQTFLQLCVSVW